MTKDIGNFYRLSDGTQADPKDVSTGKDGVMRHKNGLAVLLNEDGTPQTIGQEAVDNKNVEAAEGGKDAAADDMPVKDMKQDDAKANVKAKAA